MIRRLWIASDAVKSGIVEAEPETRITETNSQKHSSFKNLERKQDCAGAEIARTKRIIERPRPGGAFCLFGTKTAGINVPVLFINTSYDMKLYNRGLTRPPQRE